MSRGGATRLPSISTLAVGERDRLARQARRPFDAQLVASTGERKTTTSHRRGGRNAKAVRSTSSRSPRSTPTTRSAKRPQLGHTAAMSGALDRARRRTPAGSCRSDSSVRPLSVGAIELPATVTGTTSPITSQVCVTSATSAHANGEAANSVNVDRIM